MSDTRSILLVENEVEMRRIIADVLRTSGYDVVAPVDSYVALEFAQDGAYDLVILEDRMPLVDGKAFARALLENSISLPLLLLSDSLKDRDLQAFQDLGVREILHKPFPIDRLLDTVQRMFQGQSAAR